MQDITNPSLNFKRAVVMANICILIIYIYKRITICFNCGLKITVMIVTILIVLYLM